MSKSNSAAKKTLLGGYFRSYDEIQKNVIICTDANGQVISVENLSKTDAYELFYQDELMVGLAAGHKMSFGNLRFKSDDLKVALKVASVNYEDDESEDEKDFEYGNCHD